MTVCVPYVFLTEPWAGLDSVIVAFPGHTHLHFRENVQAEHLGIAITDKMGKGQHSHLGNLFQGC